MISLIRYVLVAFIYVNLKIKCYQVVFSSAIVTCLYKG